MLLALALVAGAADYRPMSPFRAMRTASSMARELQLAVARTRYPQEYVEVYPGLVGARADAAVERLRAAGIEVRGSEGGVLVRAGDQASARLIADGLTEGPGPYVATPSIRDWER